MRRLLCLAAILALLCAALPALGEGAGITYEIFVASFADSDGDGCGDLRGVIDKLDYIEALGASRIWLMPISPSPSYHKYDVTDYYAIDPAYGTMDDFDALVSACRARDIDVVIDLVVNHTSSEHPWFRAACEALADGSESPYIGWYNFTQGSGQHIVPGADDWYYEGQFVYSMPDLNLDSEEVRGEIARIMAFWQGHGVKGFRLDACTSFYTGDVKRNTAFLRFLCDTARAADPDCYIVGEVWSVQTTLLSMYESGVNSLFNFPAADQDGRFLKSAMKGTGAVCGEYMAEWNAAVKAVSPASLDAPFLTNHDLARVRGMLRSDVDKMKTAAMLYLLMPGYPAMYYGEEIGMSGSGRDENKRQAMLWSAADPAANCQSPADCDQAQRLETGVAEQIDDPASLLSTYRALAALRRLAPELIHGDMTALDAGSRAVCFYRVDDGGSAVAVLVNAGSEPVTVDVSCLGGVHLLGTAGQAAMSGSALTLSPVSCALLRLDR